MLIDDFLPQYDFSERHQRAVPATPDAVRRALATWRPDESFLWRWLLRLRGLGRPRGTLREWAEGNGFLCLGETEEEILYGQAGRFWTLNERAALVSPRTVEEFRALADPRYAVAVMNVHLTPRGPNETLVTTETRIRALAPAPRRWFRLYWLLIRLPSGLLRGAMLRGIEAKAASEAPAQALR